MATLLIPTTELEAVNQMLGTIMEAPINTLQGVESLDAQKAIAVLAEVSRLLQSEGWNFNTEVAMPLAQDAFTGEITLPGNCISVDPTDTDAALDLVQRGNRLYDRANHTYVIGKSVKVDMTVLLSFDELPEVARKYIAVMASRVFQKRQVGSTTLDGFTAEDENKAMRAFKRVMRSTTNPNIFNSPDQQRMRRRQ